MNIENTASVYPHRLIVGSDDIDGMNHVNNLRYLKWCLQAAGAHSKHVGWSSSRYQEAGYGFVVRGHQIKYRIPGLLGDEVVVNTWVSKMEKVSSERRYHIIRTADGKRLAEAKTTWVFVNLKTLELARIPDEIRAAFNRKSEI